MPRPAGKRPRNPEWVALPTRLFLYTPDQVAMILNVDLRTVMASYLWYEGRQVGAHDYDKLRAVDISEDRSKPPRWRVSEQELIRWMRRKGFKYYERGWVE
jgi:hypothetical protein